MGFEELRIHPDILKAIKRNGFVEPTPIQSRCIPEIKAGRDVVGQSLTGSGKTAAFGIPLLESIHAGQGVQSLILAPTRELALQVCDNLVSLASFTSISITAVYGGVGMQPQIDALKHADVVVATPGRMLDHLERNTANLRKVHIFILDEADKMFEMGFIDDVRDIISYLPEKRQTLLFSATMPAAIHHLIREYLNEPSMIKEQIHVDTTLLKQVYYEIRPEEKFSFLVHLLKHKTPDLAIVFCATRRQVDVLARNLKLQHINAMAVHGGLSQHRRTHAVDSLKKENIQVLVATDIAARGLDIQNISHIYNYDSPKSSNDYTHRIGRTARAGKYGEAVTLLSHKDYDNFRNVLSDSQIKVHKEELPQFEHVPFMREQHRAQGRFPSRQPFGHSRSPSRFHHVRGGPRGRPPSRYS